jgi:hypothetical protein
MFEGSKITKAEPASFSFDIPLTIEKDESIVLDLATDLVGNTGNPESSASTRHNATEAGVNIQQLKSFDIYVQTGSSTFKLEGALITGATFDFVPQNQFTLRIEGKGKKLTRAGDESFTIPGVAQSESSTRTPLIVYPVISADSLNMTSILSVNLQIQNQINWVPFENIHNSESVTNSSNALFPSAYTMGKRTISGEIRQYQTDNNITQFDDFSTSTNLTIKAIQVGKASNATPFFQININPVMYTARMKPEEVYTQSYDFRSLDNTGTLNASITNYIN